MITTIYGYLEAAYLLSPYLAGLATVAVPSQIERRIESSAIVRSEIEAKTARSFLARMQLDRRIDSGSSPVNLQIARQVVSGVSIPSQIERINQVPISILTQIGRQIASGSALFGQQLDQRVESSNTIAQQLSLQLVKEYDLLTQLSRFITSGSKVTRTELGRGPVSHQICDGYLVDPYLTTPYLAPTICAHLLQQIDRRLEKSGTINTQIEGRIEAVTRTKQQLQRRIEAVTRVNSQLLRTNAVLTNSQLLISIYNTTNLRILYEFPSRGTSGTNWTVVAGGTAAGDRGINNVNTDIVEQVYRSTATTVTLQCDTQISQGIFLDTLAVLGHNFTTSASVTLQGSNDLTFSTTPFVETLTVERENLYYIAPTLPLTSYRYWRLVVVDVTNTDGYIQIGTIVFGSAVIFNDECFTDEVIRRKTHFADRIRTEGYSAVSNDRALKRGLGLRFQRLNYNKTNYSNLVTVIDYVRTSLKALWIPTPQYASRFAVFGKLAEIPVETHKAISEEADYIDLDINVDEAL